MTLRLPVTVSVVALRNWLFATVHHAASVRHAAETQLQIKILFAVPETQMQSQLVVNELGLSAAMKQIQTVAPHC